MTIKEALAVANKSIAKKIDEALSNEVFETVQTTEMEKIMSEVYDVYDPKIYIRRGDMLGMGDPDNIVMVGGKARGGKLEVVNITEPNPYGDKATVGKNLPELIEYGHGYKGYVYDYVSRGRYMKPRPFTAETIEELKEGRDHVRALKAGLKRQGLEVED